MYVLKLTIKNSENVWLDDSVVHLSLFILKANF